MCEGVEFFFKPLASTNSKLLSLVGQGEMRSHKDFFPYCEPKLHLYVFLNFGYPCVVIRTKSVYFIERLGAAWLRKIC